MKKKDKYAEFWQALLSGKGNQSLAMIFAITGNKRPMLMVYKKANERIKWLRRLAWVGLPTVILINFMWVLYVAKHQIHPSFEGGSMLEAIWLVLSCFLLMAPIVSWAGCICWLLMGDREVVSEKGYFESKGQRFLDLFFDGKPETTQLVDELHQLTWDCLLTVTEQIKTVRQMGTEPTPFREGLGEMIDSAMTVGLLPEKYVVSNMCYEDLFAGVKNPPALPSRR